MLLCVSRSAAVFVPRAHVKTKPKPKPNTKPFAGGNDYAAWFALAGKGAAIQTFWGYHNEPHLAPQLARPRPRPSSFTWKPWYEKTPVCARPIILYISQVI